MNSTKKEPFKLALREFTMQDYDAVRAVWDDAGLPCRPQGRDSRKNIQKQLKQPCTIFLLAELDKKIIGTLFGTHDGRKGWINRLAVIPSFRKQGVAAALMAEVEQRFSALGVDIVACLIEEWNVDSMQIFENLGYTRHKDIIYFTKRENPTV